MQYFTIGQYFNKLYIILLLIVMLPIFLFIGVYIVLADGRSIQHSPILSELVALVLIDWTVMFFLFNKKIKSIANDQGLGLKLQKYLVLTIVRYFLVVSVCVVLVIGFYFTQDDRITALFGANLLMLGILWPTSAKVCRDLKLKGDEYEMVFYKKDHF